MANKKTTQRRPRRKPADLRQRAQAIIEDAARYSESTRASIRYALDSELEDLGVMVERAEAGDEVWDMTRIDTEQATAALALVKLLDLPGLPDFFTAALHMILAHAARVKGVAIATGGGQDARYSVKGLADLFAVTSGYERGLWFEPERDFAELLSAALSHPDCPKDIFNAAADCDSLHNRRPWYAPESIRFALGLPGSLAPAPHAAPARPDETDRDAEAIVRILNSPRVPEGAKNALASTIKLPVDTHRREFEHFIAAVLRAEQKGGE